MAITLRVPLHEVQSWPAYELDLYEHFLAKEPTAEARVEIAVARLCELFVKAWGGQGSGRVSVMDYLPFMNTWAIDQMSNDPRYSEVDREVFKAFK